MIKTKYWIKDFNKIKESDWILKLLSIDNTDRNFKQLATGNNISEVFLSDELLYRHITTDIDSIIEQDSISLITELIHLKEKTSDELRTRNSTVFSSWAPPLHMIFPSKC